MLIVGQEQLCSQPIPKTMGALVWTGITGPETSHNYEGIACLQRPLQRLRRGRNG